MSIRTLTLPTALGASWYDFAWPSKAPADDLDYQIDATKWLADAGLSVISVETTCSPSLAVSSPIHQGSIIRLRISGGTPETKAVVRVLLHLSSDEDLEVVVSLPIRAAAPEGLIPGGNGPPPTADGTATTDTITITADAG